MIRFLQPDHSTRGFANPRGSPNIFLRTEFNADTQFLRGLLVASLSQIVRFDFVFFVICNDFEGDQSDIEMKSVWNGSATEIDKKWTRTFYLIDIVVKSKWDRSESKWHRCELEGELKWHQIRSKCHRSWIGVRSEWNRKWSRGDIGTKPTHNPSDLQVRSCTNWNQSSSEVRTGWRRSTFLFDSS